jgi:PEP-CTERM motif
MKKVLIFTALLAIGCIGFTGVAKADSTLFINGGAGDPNLISSSSFLAIQNSGGAGTITDLILLFSVPTGFAAPSGLTSSAGALGSISLAGNLAGSASCNNSNNDVYSCAGFSGTNQSNNLANLAGAELAINGITASSFDIYTVTITGADLAAKGAISVGGNFGIGTFVDAYGTVGDKTFDTPFTEAGLTTDVPEPASLTLLGLSLVGVPFLRRRK